MNKNQVLEKLAQYLQLSMKIIEANSLQLNHKMKCILIGISLLGIVLLSTCKKAPAAHHDPIDSFLVANFNFKPGTYWIYKDSLTSEEDSFFVIDYVFSSKQNSSNSTGLADYISYDILQYNNKKDTISRWRMGMIYNEYGLYYFDKSGNMLMINDYFLITPYQIGLLEYNDADSGYVTSTNSYYTVKSILYYDVVIFNHKTGNNPLYPHYDNTYYVSTGIGIIKMDLNQDTHNIWELERYKIVR